MRRAVVLAVLAAFLGVAAEAGARTVVVEDDAGRPITLDVRAPDVDAEWYAGILRGALHGDEISAVTIRIVTWERLGEVCGSSAAGCYRTAGDRALIFVPPGQETPAAHTLLHEYAHHLDSTISHRSLPELNGTRRWWAARGMGRLLDSGRVAFDYSLGWEREIGEVFAEDYAQLHLEAPYKIDWLPPPGPRIRAALKRDLGAGQGEPEPIEGLEGEPGSPALDDPLVIVRSGTLAPGERRVLPFGLLGPGRHVTFTARVAGAREPRARARLELICGRRLAAKRLRRGDASATIDVRGLGPASCEVALASSSTIPRRYVVRLRLAVEA